MKKLLVKLLILPSIWISTATGQNVLKESGFESVKSWNCWGGEQDLQAHSGKWSLKIHNTEPKWSGADQIIYLSDDVERVIVSGWMSTDNVQPGDKPWEKARIAVEFHNENNTMVGDYVPVVGETQGDSDYNFFQKEYYKPKRASRLKLIVALANCTGAARFDDLRVILYSSDNQVVGATSLTGPKDQGAWYKIPTFPDDNGSHYVDWSSLLESPAGGHGFVKAVGDHLEFEDGTLVKFWGTNLVAGDCFPEKAKADSIAQRLSKMGCNMVRLHHMDAPWAKPNIFGNKPSSLSLSEESLDKLDYLIYALKQKGIYIYLDLLVHRDFSVADGISNKPPDLGGKQVGFFSRDLIELQKKYITHLLSHKNKYTKTSYADEPAIAGSEFINESSVFMHFGGDILTEPYRAELQKQFEKVGYKGKKLAVFDYDWGSGETIQRKGDQGDVVETIEFLTKTERNYFKELTEHMRKLGVKYPLSGSNFPPPILAYQKNNALNDIVLTNAYWDHPQLWKINNDWSKVLWAPFDNNAMIRTPEKSIIHQQTQHQWCDKPFLITEYNIAYPNEFNLEGVPFSAAYAALQGYDGLLQFHADHNAVGNDRLRNFILTTMPEHVASWVVAAPMFLRGDVKKAPGIVVDQISSQELTRLPLYSDYLDKQPEFSYITKVVKCDSGKVKPDVLSVDKFYDKSTGAIRSETGELYLDPQKGIFQFNTGRSCGVIGKLNGISNNLKWMDVRAVNTWASVMLVSASDFNIDKSQKLYLTVITPTKMNGDEYNASRNGMAALGEGPIMAQVFAGRITLKLDTNKVVSVFERLSNGTKGQEMKVEKSNEGFVVNLAQGRSFVYEVLIEESK